jgi:hypothetical protein
MYLANELIKWKHPDFEDSPVFYFKIESTRHRMARQLIQEKVNATVDDIATLIFSTVEKIEYGEKVVEKKQDIYDFIMDVLPSSLAMPLQCALSGIENYIKIGDMEKNSKSQSE